MKPRMMLALTFFCMHAFNGAAAAADPITAGGVLGFDRAIITARDNAGVRQAYAAIRPRLLASALPVLLPMPIPPAIGTVRAITVVSADRGGYYVAFSPIVRCAGALSCTCLHVAGYRATPQTSRRLRGDRPVRLLDGTRAIFRPRDCSGASCTEASLTFMRRGTAYEIDASLVADDLALLESVYGNLRRVR
jgi:hypothetical protein